MNKMKNSRALTAMGNSSSLMWKQSGIAEEAERENAHPSRVINHGKGSGLFLHALFLCVNISLEYSSGGKRIWHRW